MTPTSKLTVIPSADQQALGSDLYNELRSIINEPKYNHLTIGQLIGVLEMLKLDIWQLDAQEKNT